MPRKRQVNRSDSEILKLKYVNLTRYFTIFICFLLWVWLRGILIEKNQPTWLPLNLQSLQLILDALCATLIAGLVIQILSEKFVQENFTKSIFDAILLDPSFVSQLNDNAKRRGIKTLLNDLLIGHQFSDTIFNSLIDPYLDSKKLSLRESKRYDAKIFTSNSEFRIPYGNGEIHRFDTSDYHLIDIHNVFSIPMRSIWRDEEYVEVIISLDHNQFIEAFNQPFCVFRDMLSLNDNDRNKFISLLENSGTNNQTVSNQIRSNCTASSIILEFKINRRNLNIGSLCYDPKTGIRIRYNFDSKILTDIYPIDFDIHLRIPFSKNESKYSIVYGEPTKVNLVTLDVSDIKTCAFAWTLMLTASNPDNITVSEPLDGRVEFNVSGEWVFPTSGVVFYWK